MDYKIFDGHNDVLFRLFLKNKPDSYLDFIDGDNEGTFRSSSNEPS